MNDFLDWCATAPLIGLDTESNGEPIRDSRGYAQGVSLSILGHTGDPLYHYLPFRHRSGRNLEPKYLEKLKDVLYYRAQNGLPFSAHNALSDIASLRTLGIDLASSFYYCTLLMSHLVDEILPYTKSLEECIKRYTNLEGKKDDEAFTVFVKRFGWAEIPSEFMYEYASWDAELHRALKVALQKRIDAEKLEDYWREYKQPTLQVVDKMMSRGVSIDVDLCNTMAAVGDSVMDEIRDTIQLNPGSNKDLKTLLIDELHLPVVKWTDGGKSGVKKPSFDKYAMEEYDVILERQESPLAQLVFEYRGWQKSVSSNYRPYVSLLSPDGRLRPNYKLHGTKTLRWSCELPNLQQIPRISSKPWNGKMKQCFIARPGYVLIEADFSQLEFRLAAGYGRDPMLLEIFADPNRDVFTEIAAEMNSPRQDVKLQIYSTGYGAGPDKVAMILGISRDEAYRRIKMYDMLYPGIRSMSNLAMQTAKNKAKGQKVKIWSGRYRHFNHPYEAEHKAFNSAIQGGAADFVENRMQALYREIDSEDCRMLLQIHDSVLFEVREDLVVDYSVAIKETMEYIPAALLEVIDPAIKFKVDVHEWGH